MSNLLKTLRQARCLHWFDPVRTNEYEESFGAIVCCEQKTQRYTEESRTCSRCGLIDTRRVGTPTFVGWT